MIRVPVRCIGRFREAVQRGLWALSSLFLPGSNAIAGSITTPEIVELTLGALPHCLKWTLIGLCVWLDCDLTGCRIRISVLWGHYNPDLVISGYHRVGENPWLEMAVLYGPLQKRVGQRFVDLFIDDIDIGEGNRPDDKYHRAHKDLRFKESDAIGHPLIPQEMLGFAIDFGLLPATAIVADRAPPAHSLDLTPLLCPRETQPFTPYFLSILDFIAWRLSIPESIWPQALIPGMREIGHWPINTWQAVYPRAGWTLQTEDPKAGAVVSQRAGDIVTRTGQPHVYIPTSATRANTSGVKVWYPGPLFETDRKTGMFQMLVPLENRNCEVFGQTDLLWSWANGKSDLPVPHHGDGDRAMDYAFNLWRPYECCKIKGEILLTTLRWTPFPP